MKKFIRNFFLCFLVFTFAFCSFIGCTGESGETGTSVSTLNGVTFNGTHNVSAPDTNKDFVLNGVCDYTVIIPSGAKTALMDAKNDLLILFKKATGVSLPVKADNSITSLDTSNHYISLGETSLVANAGISKNEYSVESIKSEGFRIITKNNTIFILGGSDFGVSNGVYKFLEIYFNFDYYYKNCIDLDTGVKNCKLKNFDVTEVPDINHFYGPDYTYHWGRGVVDAIDTEFLGAGTVSEEIKYMNHRSGNHASSNELLMPIYEDFDTNSSSSTMHNCMYYIPKSFGDNAFSQGKSQLCYTAHGDNDLLNQMVDTCAEKIIFSLKNFTPDKYPYMNYVSFTMADNSDICQCDACKADYELYADYNQCGYAYNLIKFSNKVAEKVDAWLEEQKNDSAEFHNAYREDFTILIFGYNLYTIPPVDENFNPFITCHKRLGVWHVSSHGFSAYADVYDSTWPGAVEQVKGWAAVTKDSKLWFWHNSGNVVNNSYFSDGFTTYSNNFFELMAYGNYDFIYSAHYLNGGRELTAWQNLLSYVQNKLRWDCRRDMDFYIKKYMKAMFKDASDIMYNLLESERVYYQKLVIGCAEDNDWGRGMRKEENYPFPILKGWLDQCDEAISTISSIKDTDPILYKVVKQRIEGEASAQIFRIIDLYGSKTAKPFSDSQLALYKDRLHNIGILSPGLSISGTKLTDIT